MGKEWRARGPSCCQSRSVDSVQLCGHTSSANHKLVFCLDVFIVEVPENCVKNLVDQTGKIKEMRN